MSTRARLGATASVRVAVAVAAIIAATVSPGAVAAPTETAPRHGVEQLVNVPFTASDGVQLVGSVYYPTDLRTGRRSPGTFPVLIDMTPYGMWDGNSRVPKEGSDHLTMTFFAERGYIGLLVDTRGSGRSAGGFTPWDPRQMRDYLEVIDFAAKELPGSSGVVGLTGMSYRGLNQLLVGGLLKPGTPVRAMAPSSAGATIYDDPLFGGGIPSSFLHAYPAILGVSSVPPPDQTVEPGGVNPAHTARMSPDRGWSAVQRAELQQNVAAGGHLAYRDQWWNQREPIGSAEAIVRAGVPVLLTSGPTDFFARGSLRMYSALQSASKGRSPWAPMEPDDEPDPRFQLVFSNAYTDGLYAYPLEYTLQWYDRWLKGVRNGVGEAGDQTLHIQETGGADRWVRVPGSTYPMTRDYRPYFLRSGGRLTPTPAADGAADRLAWAPGQSLTYTTEPFAGGSTLAGPVALSVTATSTRPDVQLVATLYDVAPDGTATTVVPGFETDGALIGSQRQVDEKRSWFDHRGRPMSPHHRFALATESAVPTGEPVTFDLDLHPRMWRIEPGHRIRVVLESQHTRLVPTAPQSSRLAGGQYVIATSGKEASFLNLPLLPLDAYETATDPASGGLGS